MLGVKSGFGTHRRRDRRLQFGVDHREGLGQPHFAHHGPARWSDAPVDSDGKKRQTAAFAGMLKSPNGPEDQGSSERCITYGSPQLMAGYQSYYQIVQTPKAVMFMTEMIHDVRTIPIDGGPHVPSGVTPMARGLTQPLGR